MPVTYTYRKIVDIEKENLLYSNFIMYCYIVLLNVIYSKIYAFFLYIICLMMMNCTKVVFSERTKNRNGSASEKDVRV